MTWFRSMSLQRNASFPKFHDLFGFFTLFYLMLLLTYFVTGRLHFDRKKFIGVVY